MEMPIILHAWCINRLLACDLRKTAHILCTFSPAFGETLVSKTAIYIAADTQCVSEEIGTIFFIM